MPLNPTFAVTPVHPYQGLYDSIKSIWKYRGILQVFGDFLQYWSPQRLVDQYNQDKAVLRYSPIPSASIFPSGWTAYSVARLLFKTDADTDNQYLLIYHVSGSGEAAFFLWEEDRMYTERESGLIQHHGMIYNDSTIGRDQPGLGFDKHLALVGPPTRRSPLWRALAPSSSVCRRGGR